MDAPPFPMLNYASGIDYMFSPMYDLYAPGGFLETMFLPGVAAASSGAGNTSNSNNARSGSGKDIIVDK